MKLDKDGIIKKEDLPKDDFFDIPSEELEKLIQKNQENFGYNSDWILESLEVSDKEEGL